MTSIWPFWILTCLNNLKKSLFSACCAFILMFNGAYAAEITVFTEAKSFKERQVVRFVQQLENNATIEFKLSNNDLNNDLIDEYVVKPLKCINNSYCPHYIIALKNREPILLLEAGAYKLNVLDQTSYGVRDLRLNDNKNNEFRSSLYKWNPYSYRYEQKQF